jgi:tRNA-2-methylthio-N6-dimethylallyladenosine synthase
MPAYNKEALQKKLPFLDGFIEIADARKYPARRANSRQAWIAIMSGCNNFCSYCIVPYARGREKSRSVEEITAELERIDYAKQDLLYLLGQNVNSYAGTLAGKIIDFPSLLEKIILDYPQVPHLNFMTSHPKDMSDHLIDLIAKYPKIDREIHFPLQAGSNRILRLMNRGYTYEQYQSLVGKLRAKAPDVRISTDLIVGFPGETEEEFQDTLRAVKELKFDRVNTAAYSARSGTASAEMSGQLSPEIKALRLQKLMKVVDEYKL